MNAKVGEEIINLQVVMLRVQQRVLELMAEVGDFDPVRAERIADSFEHLAELWREVAEMSAATVSVN